MHRATSLSLSLVIGILGCAGENETHPPDRPGYGAPDAAPLSCVPNLDGRIDASELTPALGVPVSYLINPAGKDRTVDLLGRVEVATGNHVWDLSSDYADDAKLTLTASASNGRWWAASFPSDAFTTPLDPAGSLDGVYRARSDGLYLLGIASHEAAPKEGKTLLVYDAPAKVIALPLVVGASWVAAVNVTNGTIRGLPYAGKDVYEIVDDATGSLALHDLTFAQVHRVRTKLTASPSAGAPVVTQQTSFFFECFGEVARATSKPGETKTDFTDAAELRRLGQ